MEMDDYDEIDILKRSSIRKKLNSHYDDTMLKKLDATIVTAVIGVASISIH